MVFTTRLTTVVEYMVNNEINEFNRNRGPSQSGNDLNTIVIKVLEGAIPLEDYIEFSTMHGYSVGGFCDSIDTLLDNFPGETEDWFVIENPLWDEKRPEGRKILSALCLQETHSEQ